MIIRYAINIPVIILIAYITDKVISSNEKKTIYENVEILK